METPQNISIEKLSAKAGILICLAFIAYFLLMKYMHLADVPELRCVNFLIQFAGLILTFRYFRSKTHKTIDYIEGISLGFFTAAVSTILFAIFIYVYFSVIDPVLLNTLKESAPMLGQYLSPFSAGLTIVIEGFISGLILSLALMQYYKNDPRHARQEHHEHNTNTNNTIGDR